VSQATKTHSAIARGFHARKVKEKQQRGQKAMQTYSDVAVNSFRTWPSATDVS